jgi:Pyridoxamine 5'-phosphate oxidase
MTSFAEVQRIEPELATRARAILSSTTNAILGTIHRDGTPRLSGADPYFHDGQLRLWSMPQARKGHDMRRDPRIALHSIPWDSRRLREGAGDVGPADTKISGIAELVTDTEVVAAFRTWLQSERGPETPADWDLFNVDIESVTVISADTGQLVVDLWSSTKGRTTTRRA